MRSIPDKLLGVVALLASIIFLLLLPFLDRPLIRSSIYKPFIAKLNILFMANCIVLGYIGQSPLEEPFLFLGRLSTLLYFAYFFIFFFISSLDNLFVSLIKKQHINKNLIIKNSLLFFAFLILITISNVDLESLTLMLPLVISKTKTTLISFEKGSKKIIFRFMSRSIVKTVTKMTTSITTPVNIQGLKYDVTDIAAQADTSKTRHPTVVETKCNDTKCYDTNCAKDISNCDPETQTCAIVAHRSHSPEKANPEYSRVNFEADVTSLGPVTTVVHTQSEPLAHAEIYESYRYHDSMLLQKDENTNILKEITKNNDENDI